ncbi:hypothetical protein ACJX0J_022329, partial [Zea mays]
MCISVCAIFMFLMIWYCVTNATIKAYSLEFSDMGIFPSIQLMFYCAYVYISVKLMVEHEAIAHYGGRPLFRYPSDIITPLYMYLDKTLLTIFVQALRFGDYLLKHYMIFKYDSTHAERDDLETFIEGAVVYDDIGWT